MRLVLFCASLIAGCGGLAACGGSSGNADGGVCDDMGDYPCGPYGFGPGSTIANLQFSGRRDDDKDGTAANDSIRVTGHTDNVGGEAANQKLSLRRANAVKQYLAKHGIDPAKIKTSGQGKTKPIADNKSAQGRARNRRVQIEINGTRTL